MKDKKSKKQYIEIQRPKYFKIFLYIIMFIFIIIHCVWNFIYFHSIKGFANFMGFCSAIFDVFIIFVILTVASQDDFTNTTEYEVITK